MHHLFHTAAVILSIYSTVIFVVGLVVGVVVGRVSKR